jgi:hypothetical protein
MPDKQADWDQYLGLALFGYRTSRSSGLERSPFYMCYGFEPTIAITSHNDRIEDKRQRKDDFISKRAEQISKINKKATLRAAKNEAKYTEQNLRVGNWVLRLFDGRPTKLHPKWDGPFPNPQRFSKRKFQIRDTKQTCITGNCERRQIETLSWTPKGIILQK